MSALYGGTFRNVCGYPAGHPVISIFMNLDPSNFATAQARASEVTSLLDGARRMLREDALAHEERLALEERLDQIEEYLRGELDASHKRGVAIYASSGAEGFEVVPLPEPVQSETAIDLVPRLEPLLVPPEPAKVCVTLVNRREAKIVTWNRDGPVHAQELEDEVHGQHRQGGWSEANYERSIEDDVDKHLRRTAACVFEAWRAEGFERLVLGGPHEVVTRFIPELNGEIAPLRDETELKLDVNTSSLPELEEALAALRVGWRAHAQAEALRAVLSGQDREGVAIGLVSTLAALNERRVQTLVLVPQVDEPGAVCPTCGELWASSEDVCPADGALLRPLPSLRSAIVHAAVAQDAQVIVLSDYSQEPTDPADTTPPLSERAEVAAIGGMGALLRY